MDEMEISCTEVLRETSNYIDSDIDPELRLRLEEHLRLCSHCKAVVDGAQNVVRLIGDNTKFKRPEAFSKRLYNKKKKVFFFPKSVYLLSCLFPSFPLFIELHFYSPAVPLPRQLASFHIPVTQL